MTSPTTTATATAPITLELEFSDITEQMNGTIGRVIGTVTIRQFAKIISGLNLDANPRVSRTGRITDAIMETIDTTPELFAYKSKGVLLASTQFTSEDNLYRFTFSNRRIEGILDGGHNSLAIALFVLGKLTPPPSRKIKTWSEMKEVWMERSEGIEELLADASLTELDAKVPVEVLVPGARDEDTVQDFSDALLDICAARNNNAELKAEAKLNRAGYFDDLKHALPQGISDNVQWRTNDTGRLKVGDVIAMAWIPLSCIDLPKDADGKQIEAPTPTSLYSGKAKLLDRFEDVMSSPEVTKPSTESINERTEEVVLYNEKVRSALNLTRDFIDIFERINAELPDLYNKSGGKFGGIDAVDKANKKNPRTGKTPQKYSKFYRQPIGYAIPDGFIYPLVYAFAALLKQNEDGTVYWGTDWHEFFNNHMGSLVKDYRETSMNMLNRDPQKVGKEAGSYTNLLRSAQLALFTEQQ